MMRLTSKRFDDGGQLAMRPGLLSQLGDWLAATQSGAIGFTRALMRRRRQRPRRRMSRLTGNLFLIASAPIGHGRRSLGFQPVRSARSATTCGMTDRSEIERVNANGEVEAGDDAGDIGWPSSQSRTP